MKKIAALLACVYLAAHLTGCTSNESREDEMNPPQETAAVDSELEQVEGADAAAAGALGEEQLPEQALGEAAPADPGAAPAPELAAADPAAPAPGGDELSLDAETNAAGNAALDAANPPPPLDSGIAPTEPPPSDMTAMNDPLAPSSQPPLAEPALGVDPGTDTAAAASTSAPTDMAAAAPSENKPKPSLKKIRTEPFHENNILLNAVYIAQPGDNYGKISKKIYGDKSKVGELKKANPYISSVAVGDKVYYNSPQRPTDETTMKTWQEDQGLQSEVYVAKEGDDLKKVAKELLGNKSGWKELWVTNKDLESKGKLTAGTEIHYFKPSSGGTDGAVVAKNDAAPPAEMAPPADGGMTPPAGEVPPPPPAPDMAQAVPPPPPDQLPPPPDMNPPAAAGTNGMDTAAVPPPPPPAEMAPPPPPPVEQAPPPPPPAANKQKPVAVAADGFSNDDMMMALGAVGILAAGIAALMVMRKRRQQREMAAAFGDTQVGA